MLSLTSPSPSFLRASTDSLLLFFDNSPRRTIATAQTLFHRFHLFFALKDFVYHVRSTFLLLVLVPALLSLNSHLFPFLASSGRHRLLPLRGLQDARHPQETQRHPPRFLLDSLPGEGEQGQRSRWRRHGNWRGGRRRYRSGGEQPTSLFLLRFVRVATKTQEGRNESSSPLVGSLFSSSNKIVSSSSP